MSTTRWIALVFAATLALASCGGDNGGDASPAPAGGNTETPADASGDSGDSDGAPSSDSSGTLVLDGETIEFDRVSCYLQPQPDAGSGGTIEFVVQGFATNAAGEDIRFDLSRYGEDSDYAGDIVSVNVGDLGDENSPWYEVDLEAGTLVVSGETFSASDFTMGNMTFPGDVTASFEIAC